MTDNVNNFQPERDLAHRTFGQLPIDERYEILCRAINDQDDIVRESNSDDETARIVYSALVHERAATLLQIEGLDEETSRKLAQKIVGEGMHILKLVGAGQQIDHIPEFPYRTSYGSLPLDDLNSRAQIQQ